MERNNTRKTNKNKNIKHKNQTTLLTNIAQKNTRIAGKTAFFRDWKQNKKEEQKHKTKQNKNTKNEANITTKKQKGWNRHNENNNNNNNNNRRKKKQPKAKANWISKRGC